MNDARIDDRLISSLKPHPLNETIYHDSSSPSDDLINSIKEFGFNDRITISKDDVIISGHRRWLALKALKYETVPVFVLEETDPDKLTEYLITMNQTSRIRTQEQIIREGKILKEIEERKAKARREAGNNQYSPMENCPQPSEKGSSRDIAASKLNANISGKTLDKGIKVLEIADEIAKNNPAKAQDIKDTLNNVSVNAAIKKVKDTPKVIEATPKKVTQKSLMENILHKNMMPDAMDKAYRDFEFEIQKAHEANWETVSKEAVSHFINKLMVIVEDGKEIKFTCPICNWVEDGTYIFSGVPYKHPQSFMKELKDVKPATAALHISHSSISRMEAIMPDDPNRILAYEQMIEWCKSAIEDARGRAEGWNNDSK